MWINYRNDKKEFVPILLLSWITLLYFSEILLENDTVYQFVIGGLVLFGGLLLKLKNKTNYINKSSFFMIIYFIILLATLTLAAFFADDQIHSFTRSIFSIGMYFITFFVFVEVGNGYIQKNVWRRFLSQTFLITLLVILVGQLLIPEWRMGIGGIRMTGGTNPNNVSFLAFFIIFISHFNSIMNGKWTKIDKANWVLANIVMLWSLSRSSLLGYFIFYFLYFGWFIVKQHLYLLLKGKISKKLIKHSFLFLIFIFILYYVISNFMKTEYYYYVIKRLTSESGLVTRSLAWEFLLNYYKKNPLFGGVGWWNASHMLPNAEGMATSVHNLYIRLLAEVGIVGMIAVLVLPISVIIGLIVKSYSEKNVKRENLMMLLFSFLIGLFVLQFFEDKFLTGIFDLGNNIIILSLAFGYVLLMFMAK